MNIPQAKLELAREAKEIRESEAFKAALEKAKTRIINELTAEAYKPAEHKLALIAELRAFGEVEQELKSIADDLAMARRHA